MAGPAADEKSENTEVSGSSSGGAGSKLVLIIAGVNLVVTVGMVAILFISFQREHKKASVDDIAAHTAASEAGGKSDEKGEAGKHGEATRKKAGEFGKMVTLEQFTVNLATPGSATPRFVRMNITLDVPTEDSESEVNLKMPQVRNVIIDLINSKRPSDLAGAEGRDYLKDEIKNSINAFLVTGKVKGVFFTNFAFSS